MHGLLFAADQKRSGGAFDRTVLGVVREIVEVEIGAEFAVNATEQVQVEGSGYTLGIVVCTHDNTRILLHVKADEDAVVVIHDAAKVPEEIDCLLAAEIADI